MLLYTQEVKVLDIKKVLIEELNKSKQVVESATLPMWNELPKIDLYMDQVVVLLNDYLGYISNFDEDDKGVTSSMINNYVKMKIIPPPEKKKYSRSHLARLIMICALKKSLNISTVHKLLPQTDDEQENKQIYDAFVLSRQRAMKTNMDYLESEFYSTIDKGDMTELGDLLTRIAVSTDLRKLLTEKFTDILFNPKEIEKSKEKKSKKEEA